MNTNDTEDFVLADSYRAGFEHAKLGREQWIQGTLTMAEVLYRSRKKRASNQEFSEWIELNKLTYHNYDDRAALINMGEHYEITMKVLQITERWSYQLIWEHEVQPRLRSATKTDPVPSKTQTEPKQLESAPNPAPAVSQNGQSEPHTEPPHRLQGVKSTHPLAKFERHEEVRNIYLNKDTRTALGKAVDGYGGKEIWNLILTAVDNGLLRPTRISCSREFFNARMLFTDCPKSNELGKLDLTNKADRQRVKDIILPAAIANKEAIIAEPHRIMEIIQQYHNRAVIEQRETEQKKRAAAAVAAMPVGQEQVVAYSKCFWPISDNIMEYTYDQARAAAWYFRGVQDNLRGTRSLDSTVIAIRHEMKWLREYAAHRDDKESVGQQNFKRIFNLVDYMATAWQKNPEAPCKWPSFPVFEEGKW